MLREYHRLDLPIDQEMPIRKSQRESFSNYLFDGLQDVKSSSDHLIPQQSPRYLDIQRELITYSENGVTVFNGGPLDLRSFGIENAWLTPVEVRDEDGFSNFHVISINCTNGQLDFAKLFINLDPEINLKLGKNKDGDKNHLENLLKGDDKSPKVIIRPSITGSLAFPLITTPVDVPTKDIFKDRIEKLISTLNLTSSDISETNFSDIENQEFDLDTEFENFFLSKARRVETSLGTINIYGAYSLEDPWRYYEIITFNNLNELRNQGEVLVRTDSGCDIGMLYHDQGCDCRDQLHHSLEQIKNEGGLIVHIATQDGRGYGMNTKMETEAHKRGIESPFNQFAEKKGTLQAAKELFGDGFHDIRTYDGVSKMLQELGIRKVRLITDNKIKLAHLRSEANMEVNPTASETLSYCRSSLLRSYIEEKHSSDDYI